MILFILLLILIPIIIRYYWKYSRMSSYLSKCPGIPCYPIFGNIPLFTGGILKGLPNDFTVLILQLELGLMHLFKDYIVLWLAWKPVVLLYNQKYVEAVLSSTKIIEKSENYNVFYPWLGRGLLTNKGNEWRVRRKLLTPAFHFNIINDFIPIINEHSFTLIERIKGLGQQIIDICPFVTDCTLDTICSTAMGVTLNIQRDSNQEYVKALNFMQEVVMRRTLDLKSRFDFIFERTSYGKQYLKTLNILHNFTRKVIRERKQELLLRYNSMEEFNNNEKDVCQRKRKAFLDILLELHLLDSKLTEEDIREEVDTFMAAGHETTAITICWTLFLIGLSADVQRNVHKEIENVFSEDQCRPVCTDDITKLKYLDSCIKESLRLYPPLPTIARLVTEDFEMGPHTIPKGTTIAVSTYCLHRNKEVFPQPEVYRPERFLETNSNEMRRNLYSYVPFSAGPRNCIGMKFAQTEVKIVLANIFRKFTIKSVDNRYDVKPCLEITTRPKDPIRVIFKQKYT